MATQNFVYRGIEGAVKKVPAELPATLGPKEVLVKITHASVCGTDVHMIGFGLSLGHEGVGIVESIGSEVTQLAVGDRVGGGYLRNSCGHCAYCLRGDDMSCYERTIYGEGDFNNGTFGDYYIGIETYIHKIPPSISSADAAPLQCAGSTVYNAIRTHTKTGDRVGILGIGGLGHLAIQFSAKMGYDTVVFSTSKDKEAEAKGFGATEFCLLSEPEKVSKPVDVLIVMKKEVLARRGSIVALAAPMEPLEIPSFPFFFDCYNVKSSLVASRGIHADMLEFAARTGVRPVIETFEFSEKGMTEVLEKLNKGKLRYRGVLVAA